MNVLRTTYPTRSLLQGAPYRNQWHTDIRITFLLWQARQMLEKAK